MPRQIPLVTFSILGLELALYLGALLTGMRRAEGNELYDCGTGGFTAGASRQVPEGRPPR